MGHRVTIIGRSNIVGMPLFLMLAQERHDAIVDICHKNTPRDHILKCVKETEILVSAAGVPGLVTSDMLGEN